MNKFIKHITLMVLVLLSVSCDRKPLGTDCSCYTTALLPVSIDWSNLSESPTNVRLLVYDQYSGELVKKFTYEHDDNAEIQAYLPLSLGVYKVIVINEARGDLENMSIADEYEFSTTKFYVSSSTVELDDPMDDEQIYLDELDELAVYTVDNVVVSEDMSYANTTGIAYTKSGDVYVSNQLLGIKPLRKDIEMEVKLEVEGMEYAKTPVLVDLRNIANGYIVSSEKNTTVPYNMQFYMVDNHESDNYDDITTLTSTITMFGTLEDRVSLDYYQSTANLDLQFVLRFEKLDGEIEEKVVDVESLEIDSDNSINGVIKLSLKLDVTSSGAGALTPATASTDDKTTIDPDSNTGVEDWKDNETPLSGTIED